MLKIFAATSLTVLASNIACTTNSVGQVECNQATLATASGTEIVRIPWHLTFEYVKYGYCDMYSNRVAAESPEKCAEKMMTSCDGDYFVWTTKTSKDTQCTCCKKAW